MQLIHDIQLWKIDKLHLLVTSRELTDIKESLTDLITDEICLQSSETNDDIFIYVADKLANDKMLARWPPEIRAQIQEKLILGEDGMRVTPLTLTTDAD